MVAALTAVLTLGLLLFGSSAAAQPAAPPPPPPGWTGSFGAGYALTQGNSDTSTINLAFDAKRDTGSNLLFKTAGLFIRGEAEDELTTNRLGLEARVDRKLTTRTSLYGKVDYLRDEFKAIDYLASLTGGVAYLLVKNARTELGVDAGTGVVWEKNPALDLQTDGALTAGQNLTHKLTATTEITEKVLALWKMDDVDDALYTFGVGLAATVTSQTQLKIELLDIYKTRPPSAAVQKNDLAMLLSFVFKY